ncbi:MAG: 4Fe-4S dicluster domain-containing protein [Candidatus Sabulitectum sp.]|nr:4Fe-4S dicluster domain-containing protein [Candidatus Sabulitectum sp.]
MVELTVKSDLCTGCMNCQTVCALVHLGIHDRSASAIRINLELFSGINSVTYCRQCEYPMCRAACPTEAIFKDKHTGAWIINYDLCIMCGNCISACPYGAMFLRGKAPLKCDLCAGKPACAEACAFNAITVGER